MENVKGGMAIEYVQKANFHLWDRLSKIHLNIIE
jgi:hypothetical protein